MSPDAQALRDWCQAMGFREISVTVDGQLVAYGEAFEAAALWAAGGEVAFDVLRGAAARAGERRVAVGPVAEACRVMRSVLAAGPVDAAEAKRRVQQLAGVSARTVDTAKVRLGVISRKRGSRGWVWALPEGRSQAC